MKGNCYRIFRANRLLMIVGTEAQAEFWVDILTQRGATYTKADFKIEPAWIEGAGF